MAAPRIDPATRIHRNIRIDDKGCWLWQARVTNSGYGRIQEYIPGVGAKARLAHRFSYELFVGPIPDGLQIDHLCRVRTCVNPKHLEPVTARENILRSPYTLARKNADKTRCPRGHAYDATSKRGDRYCRACVNTQPTVSR